MDERGNEIKPGDVLLVTSHDANRAVQPHMRGCQFEVLELGRTRVRVSYQGREKMVPAELTRVVQAVDGRRLLTEQEAWNGRVSR